MFGGRTSDPSLAAAMRVLGELKNAGRFEKTIGPM
jgi:hypothetical protein